MPIERVEQKLRQLALVIHFARCYLGRVASSEGQFHDRSRATALPPGRKKLEFADTRSFTEELETCCVDCVTRRRVLMTERRLPPSCSTGFADAAPPHSGPRITRLKSASEPLVPPRSIAPLRGLPETVTASDFSADVATGNAHDCA